MNLGEAVHHGDTADTAKVKSVNHGGHGAHGEKQTTRQNLLLPFSVCSVSSVVNAFVFASRRVRRVAVAQMRFLG
jgi:hypothetical protein